MNRIDWITQWQGVETSEFLGLRVMFQDGTLAFYSFDNEGKNPEGCSLAHFDTMTEHGFSRSEKVWLNEAESLKLLDEVL